MKTKWLLSVFLAAILALTGVFAGVSAEEDFEPFCRIDRDDPNAWSGELENLRLLTKDKYQFGPIDEKYGVDPEFTPSETGLDTLNISGSAQFSEKQFRDLAETLRECAGGDPIYVVDCRSESHALVNGIGISYYELHNWGNPGMPLAEVEADELARFGAMPGTEQTFYTKSGEKPDVPMTIQVESCMTEKELVESEGFGYLRLVALNNHWPAANLIDDFIDFVKTLDMNHVWLHFHCQAGKGRTGVFMTIYDMMKNPDVSLEDIVTRQAMTGSNYLLYTEQSDHYKAPLYDEIARNVRLIYQYIQENRNTNYELSWSDWLANRAAETRIRVFETSDIHGALIDASSGNEETFQYRMAYIAHLVNEARASSEYADVLLLDGGDVYQGAPHSNMLHGAALRATLDAMHYDAVALGNHEFDWDVTAYATDADATVPAYEIGTFAADPDIPVLASGLYYAGTDERVPFTRDYVIVEKAGFRIALIGYIPDYRMSIMRSKIAPYDIDGDLSHFAGLVSKINAEEQPDVTIVVAHAMPLDVANALSPEDVQLVVGGHKHDGIYGMAESGVPYIQGDTAAQGYATATIVIGTDGAIRVEDLMYTATTEDKEYLYDTPENAGHLDKTILEISHAAWDGVKDEMSEVLGYIDTPIEKKGVTGDNGSTTGGNWITGLMLRATQDQGTVAAFYNTGGIRTSFTIPEGETTRAITVGDVYTIAPFGNYLYVYELTGEELRQQLMNGFVSRNFGDQMSGLTFEYVNHGSEDEKEIEIVSITLADGTIVDMEDTETLYRVCTTNYSGTLAGSVFEMKEPLVPASEAPIDNEAFIEMLRAEAQKNDGYISVDTEGRGFDVSDEAEELDDAA